MKTLQNTPLTVDLIQEGVSTGWSLSGGSAIHEECNAGDIFLRQVSPVAGHAYEISYFVDYLSSGIVRAHIGTAFGRSVGKAGFVSETIVAPSNSPLAIYATGNSGVSNLTIKDTFVSVNPDKGTIAWSETNNGWSSRRDYQPEGGFSLFTDLFLFSKGQMWRHDASIMPRCNFFGVQYKPSITFVANANRGLVRTFKTLTYESNMLLVTGDDGVQTSLGQISELNEADFLKDLMNDGINEVKIYDEEGIYSASFLRDKKFDLEDGPDLKGTYVVIKLVAAENGNLKLKNVTVNSDVSRSGSR